MILKLVCYGNDYFHEGWNRFDFLAVVGTFILLIIETFTKLGERPYAAITYVFITSKLLSLFKYAQILHKMFQTFILALPAVVNLALLFFLVIYLFDIAGVLFFADIKLQSFLEPHNNFQNFWGGFLAVYRLATFDGWNDLMHDVSRSHAQYFDCVEYPTYEDVIQNGGQPVGCGLPYAPVFCIGLELIVTFIFLNLFIAIIVGSMLDITKLSESVLSDEKLGKFQKVWQEFDPNVSDYQDFIGNWIY